MIIEFGSEVSNLAWRVSQSQNGGAIFTLTKWSPMFGSVVFDYQWCILIVMSVKSSFYNEYDIKNNEKHVLWAQRSFQNHHQTFHDRCPEKIGPLPKKSDHWFTWTCPENMGLAPTWSQSDICQPIRTSVSETAEAVYRPQRRASWDVQQTSRLTRMKQILSWYILIRLRQLQKFLYAIIFEATAQNYCPPRKFEPSLSHNDKQLL